MHKMCGTVLVMLPYPLNFELTLTFEDLTEV
jgi:hypothetical protein